MLSVTIDKSILEERITALASSHHRSPDEIVQAVLASSFSLPEIVYELQFGPIMEEEHA